MATTARLDLAIWRNDFEYEFRLRVLGPDLTGVSMSAQIRLSGDTPGEPLANLLLVTNGNQEGVRLAGTTIENGIVVNDVRIRINKTTRQALPYSGEIGDATQLAWAMQIGGRTRLVGSVILPAHAYESDSAPTTRTPGSSINSLQAFPNASATLTIAADNGATLTIDGLEVIGPLATRAEAAADRAEAAAASTDPVTVRSSAIEVIEAVEAEPINWLDPSQFTDGKILLSTGEMQDNTSFVLTDYIPIAGGQTLVLNKAPGTIAIASIVWFDASKARIGAVGSDPAANTPYEAPAGTAYARFCILKPNQVGMQVNIGRTTSAAFRYPGGATLADERRYRAQLVATRRGENIFRPDRLSGGALRADGTVDADLTDFRFPSDMLAVEPGGWVSLWFEFDGLGIATFGHQFYDLGGNFVSAIPLPTSPGSKYAVPANAYWFRPTFHKDRAASFVVTSDDSQPQGYVPPAAVMRQYARPWFNKRVSFIGDSITNAGFYIQPLLNHLGARLGFKSGVDGRQLKDALSNSPSFSTTDCLVNFLGGTNDWFYSRPLGSDTDTSTAQTFIGDIRRFVETVRAAQPDMRIVWWTSLQRMIVRSGDRPNPEMVGTRGTNSLGLRLRDYVDAIIRIAGGDYGIPVVDLFRCSGADEFNLPIHTDFSNDGTHPTAQSAVWWISRPAARHMNLIEPITG